ncbi:XRE family transcriptional regulator [Hymenobacter guriensis]|uniref:Helix-turn-helix domain-containing protein n=1 Tax=Hymenobacter guriensis TaxID=2793065 RepID=A0ABS0L7Y5_9BACT|nr:LexA family transcriptional regulator [Hymenobacter guriensis]MBG8556189.1 helix-turn-helix domain-containing protein [Hymenobacter guriensis]
MEKQEHPISQRIRILIDSFADGNQRHFAEKIGITPSAISDLFGKRKNTPGTEMLQKIAAAYKNVSMDWLLNGEEPMIMSGYMHKDPVQAVEEAQEASRERFYHLNRLKRIRELRGISLDEAAKAFGITADELHKIEWAVEGTGKYVWDVEFHEAASQLYRVSLDYLVGDPDLEMLQRLIEAESRKGYHGVPMVTVDSDQRENIAMVSTQAEASYPTRYLEQEFYHKLPAFSIPLPQFRNATFRAFEVTGNSMSPTLYPQSWVIARFVDLQAESIQEGYIYVIVTHAAVVVKRVIDRRKERGAFALQSDNEEYPTFDQAASEVLEMWRVQAGINFQFPNTRFAMVRKVASLEADMRYVMDRLQQRPDNEE